MAIVTVNTDNIGSPDYQTIRAAFEYVSSDISPLSEDTYIMFSGSATDTSLAGYQIGRNEPIDTNGYRLIVSGDRDSATWDDDVATIEINTSYCRQYAVIGLEFRDLQYYLSEANNTGSWGLYTSYASTTLLNNVYFRPISNFTGNAILPWNDATGGVTIEECVFDGTGSGNAINFGSGTAPGDISKSTIYNWGAGVNSNNANSSVIVIDIAVFNSTGNDFSTDIDSSNVSYCASDQYYGSNAVSASDWDAVFVSATGGDFTLQSDDVLLRGAGSSGNNIGWDQSSGIVEYTFTYTAGTGGVVSGDTIQTVSAGGDGTAVSAFANGGYTFSAWSDTSATSSVRQDTSATGDINAIAWFAPSGPTYTLTYFASANGVISGDDVQIVPSGTDGSEVSAIGNTGYHFYEWDDGYPTFNRIDQNVSADTSATAIFEINEYTVTYTPSIHGTISGDTNQTIQHGDDATTVSAIALSGYRFDQWSDANTSAVRTDTNVTQNLALTANFIDDTNYNVRYFASSGGYITGDTDQIVSSGDDATGVTAVASAGYEFLGWKHGDWIRTTSRTDVNIINDISMTAMFGAIDRFSSGTDITVGDGGRYIDFAHLEINQENLTGPVTVSAVSNIDIYTRWDLGDSLFNGHDYEFNGCNYTLSGTGIRQHMYCIGVSATTSAQNITWHDYTLDVVTSAGGNVGYAHRGAYPRGSHLHLKDYNSKLIVRGGAVPAGHPWYLYGGIHGLGAPENTSLKLTHYNAEYYWETDPGYGAWFFESNYPEPTKLTVDVDHIGIYSPNDSLGMFRSDYEGSIDSLSGTITNIASMGFNDTCFEPVDCVYENIITTDSTGDLSGLSALSQYQSLDPSDENFFMPIADSIAAISGSAPRLSTHDINGVEWTAPYSIGPVQYISTSDELGFNSIQSQEDIPSFNLDYTDVLSFASIDSQEDIPSFNLDYTDVLSFASIDSQEDFPKFNLDYTDVLSFASIDSQEDIPSFNLDYTDVLSFTSIDSQEDFPEFDITQTFILGFNSIDSQEDFPEFDLIYPHSIQFNSIDSQEDFPEFDLIYPHVMTFDSIQSQEDFPKFDVLPDYVLSFTSIDSQEDIPSFNLDYTDVLSFASIDSQEDFPKFNLDYPNTPPIAVDDYMRVRTSGTTNRLSNGSYSVLSNDIDPNPQILSAALIDDVSHGSLTFNVDGTFVYINDGSDNASDLFTYYAYDGEDVSNSASVFITITSGGDSLEVTCILDGEPVTMVATNKNGNQTWVVYIDGSDNLKCKRKYETPYATSASIV